MRAAICVVALVAVAGCATRPMSNDEAAPIPASRILASGAILTPAKDRVRVVVKRDTGFNSGACTTRIYANGAPLADVGTGEKVTIYLPPGDHILGAVPNGICGGSARELRATIKAGQPQSFRIGYGSSGDMTFDPTAF